MLQQLLIPVEVDRILRYRFGRSERLAKRGKLPHIRLPDGSIRFRQGDVEQMIGGTSTTVADTRSPQIEKAGSELATETQQHNWKDCIL